MDLKFVEAADAQDGLLDLCTFRDGGFFRGLYYFFAVLFRRHHSISATKITRFEQLTIESDSPVPIELDGDPAGYLPVCDQHSSRSTYRFGFPSMESGYPIAPVKQIGSVFNLLGKIHWGKEPDTST